MAVGVVVAGFVSGVLAGMFGIGGAGLTTPAIRVLGATPIEAVGSTVPAILPGAISGTVRYSRAGLVNWRVGVICGASGSLLAVVGAWVAGLVNAHYLMVLTALIVGWTGVVMFRSGLRDGPTVPDPDTETELLETDGSAEPTHTLVPAVHLTIVGAGAGFLAGLLGVGGGIVMMPVFTNVLRIPIKEAVASSLVAVAIFSIPALVTHALLGHINWAFAVLLTVGVVPGAQLGSHLTLGVSDRTVRTFFGSFLIVLALVYGATEVSALR